MSQATLLFDAAFALVTAVLYAYVGRLVQGRVVPDAAARRANTAFVVWWYGLAAYTALNAGRNALGAVGVLDLAVHTWLTYLGVLPLVALLWGLVYYLAFIYTGNPRVFWPVTIFHGAVLVFYLYLLAWLQPASVEVGDWNVVVHNVRDVTGGLLGLVLFTIVGPVLLAALAYATLYFRTDDRTARYRIGLVSGAFILWFGSALVASLVPALGHWSAWPVASRVIGLVSTLMILAAFRPPRALEARFGLRPLVPRRDEHVDSPPRGLLPFPTALRA